MTRKTVFGGVYRIVMLTALAAGSAFAQQSPALFFTDLTSGPKTGGENNKGVYVTIYGNNFGTTQGSSTVTVGSGLVDHCPVWGASWLWYQKITCQLGPNAQTGNIVVTVNGVASNTLPFTIRPGNIRYVATNGNDAADGSFGSPWLTMTHALYYTGCGDINYVRNGVVQDADTGYGSPLAISGHLCGNGNEQAFLVYPGESAQIGGPLSSKRGINTYPAGASYIIIAGFKLYFPNSSSAVYIGEGSTHWRFVGLDVSCPNGDGSTGCFTVSENGVPFTKVLGVTIHDSGCPGSFATGPCGDSQKLYHAFYWGDHDGTLLHDVEFGWGDVHNHHGCRGILIHPADDGHAEAYNISIHDNVIYNTRCDAINLSQTNADKGPVLVYNNVMYHVGIGPDPTDGMANYSCVDTSDFNGAPTTPIEVFNNTCYDAGQEASWGQGDSGAWTTTIPVRYRNNITYQLSGEAYLTRTTANYYAGNITGSNNLWYGVGNGPSQTSGNINTDPMFVNAGSAQFQLQSASPAINGGVTIAAGSMDMNGVARPQNTTYGLGAYEFATGATPPPPPAAPTAALSASPASITPGQNSMLTYSCTNCASAAINGVATAALSGQMQVTLSATTSYTLVATGAGGSAMATATVTVGSAPPPPPPAAPTASLSASPATITQGQSSLLTYSCTNCTSIVVNGSPASGLSGQAQVTPAGTTTYTVTAFGAGGSATATVTVTVNSSTQAPPPPPPAPTATLSAAPTSITQGQSAVLTYACANCTSSKINGVATAALSGQMQVTPTATTTYTLSASGAGGSATAAATVTVAATPPPPPNTSDLTVGVTHSGNFSQGQTGAHYMITVTNIGSGPTSGTVTVTDTLPAGLTATAISGTGWICTVSGLKCTRTTALAAGASYSPITVTVNVAASAPASVVNTAAVSGGGEQNTSNDTDIDLTMIGAVQPDLTISIIQDGGLAPGQTGVVYTLVVSNIGNQTTSGVVTVIDALPVGLTATAISGSGWTCALSTLKCTRSNALAAGLSYPAINVTVNVAANPPGSVTNTATVSGGNEQNTLNDTASDLADIDAPVMISIDPGVIQFSAGASASMMSQTVQMQNLGGGTLGWVQTVQTDSGDNWLVSGPISGVAPSTVAVTANPAGLAPGYYTGRIIMSALPGINAKNSPQTLKVQMVVGGVPPQVNSGGIANGASFAADSVSSPGSIAVLFGQGMATGAASANDLPLPMDLLGTEVSVNGVQAPLYFVSPTQINFQMPFEISGPAASIVVSVNGVQSAPVVTALADQAPGIFSADASGKGQAALLNEDGTPNSASNPVPAGSVIAIYLTGMGALFPPLHSGQPGGTGADVNTTPSLPTVLIGGAPAPEVLFSGAAPGLVGLDQINVRIPAGTPPGSAISLQIQTTKAISNTVTIAVQ